MPFTDEELDRIYAACDLIGGPKPPGPGYRPWGGEDVRDFVILSVYTGLRVSAVSTFNITERPKGNDVFLQMHKTWAAHIPRRASLEHAAGFGAVAENLGTMFKLAGPFDDPPTPHRRTAGETHEDPQGCFRRQAKAEAGGHSGRSQPGAMLFS